MSIIVKGEYTCPGQCHIVVTDVGSGQADMHGPWIHYRFPWETDDKAKPVLFTQFLELMAFGYAPTAPTREGGT